MMIASPRTANHHHHQTLTTDHDWGPSIMIIYSLYVWETTSHATRTTCTTHRPTPLPIHPQAPYHACEDLIALQYAHTLYLIHPSTDPHTPFAKPTPSPPLNTYDDAW